jgi:peptide/nickel transport system substrate-binding protein
MIVLLMLPMLALPSLTVSAQGPQIPREEAFYMESWEDPIAFNPYIPDVPVFRPFLEPLFVFDAWHFQIVPWLAESSEWVDNVTFRVTIHNDTMWNDGQPLTTDDVNYTYYLPVRRSEVTGVIADLWTYLEKIDVVNSTTLDFVLKADNPNKFILTQTLTQAEILPMHKWSPAEKQYSSLLNFTNLDSPVGSGPYKLYYASTSERKTIWVRDDNYWGKPYFGIPQPKYIVNIVSSSNEVANMMLEKGDIDWSENFMPNMWDLWETKHLARGSWSTNAPFYMPVPYMTGMVDFNYLKITDGDALYNPETRRALAFAINWSRLCEVAFSELTTPANPSLLPDNIPQLAQYINSTAVEQYGWSFNTTRANEILDGLGYLKHSDNWRYYSNGTKIGPYQLLIVEGWTDWEAAAEIVKEDLVVIGIDVSVQLVDSTTYTNDVSSGQFVMTFDQPSTWTPSTPWYNYYINYVSRASPAAVSPAYGNWGSYNNSRVDELLDQIAKTNPEDSQTLTSLYGELQSIVLKELPYIPGWFYGPFYMYSSTYWTNWPTENNAYTGAVPYWDTAHGYFQMLFHLQSAVGLAEVIDRIAGLQSTVTTLQYFVYIATGIAIAAVVVAVVAVIRARKANE